MRRGVRFAGETGRRLRRPNVGRELDRRQRGRDAAVIERAWRCPASLPALRLAEACA